ncbi:MAG: MEDS domain-containing protein [Candidatus Eremiobacteraeota bacterium]|nr:MEDS domain-containing protein [Candidatus Eremiobacteraeota bacterium]
MPQHVVQCYQSDEFLLGAAARFLLGRDAGTSFIVIIATPAHRLALVKRLKPNSDQMPWVGGLRLMGADETLAQIMPRDTPDPARFDQVVGSLVRQFATRGSVRIYGDMAGELYRAGKRRASAALEDLWNELARSVDFDLFCAYPIDVFDPAFEERSGLLQR